MTVDHLVAEATAIRRRVEDLQARAADVGRRAADVRHDHASVQGAVLAVLDSLDDLDRRIEALRQASRGGA